ncbi:hypothetical protein EYZ11_008487 [Aspergillus tanneri]|uniref:RING-type E3 ubiquitin transferase n=1 Tax=Aspergillus tanneri TaxID=1220188 RepID=A0A4S3JAC3_9EURO|nr:hypothetical protein EYZ11_008487 [Aspergillus tanneri]
MNDAAFLSEISDWLTLQIEIPPDPDAPDHPPDHPPDPPHNPWAHHNPWDQDGEDDQTYDDDPSGFTHHTYRSPDGRFTFSSTTYSHGLPRRRQSSHPQGNMPIDPLMPMVRGLDTIFHGLANTYQQTSALRPGQESSGTQPRSDQRAPGVTLDGSFDFDMQHEPEGLHPRDADGPQPMATPLRTLGDILELFRSDFRENGGGHGGVRVMTGPSPLAMLSALLNVERHGDAVYSQEELDRVISQLVEQNGNRTAPPPASAQAIQSLRKKVVDEAMLGSDGRAECSICMDRVEKGTEVTELPCQHWFHTACIEMWLNQHNTCPHCRRGIGHEQNRQGQNPQNRQNRQEPGRQEPAEGTSDNPVVIDDSPGPEGGSGLGGLAGWVRSRFG